MRKPPVDEHIERCIELYAETIDVNFDEAVERPHFEQMRSDLLIAVGMLSVLSARSNRGEEDNG